MSGEKEQFIVDYLLNKISNGSYKIGERIPSEYLLARKFDIDKGTANRAVSRLVTLGYLKRTRGAGGTVLIRRNLFPVRQFAYLGVFPSVHSFYARLLRGLMESAYAAGCSFTVIPFFGVKNYQVLSDRIACLQPDAIFVGGEVPAVTLPEVPVFYMDTFTVHQAGEKVFCLNPDNSMAGEILLKEIWKRGHRHVLHFSSPTSVAVQRERFIGARRCAAQLDVELKEIDAAVLPMNNLTAFKQFLPRLMKKYSVIVCENDIQAAELIGQCRRIGVDVPGDISVCSYISGPEFHHFYRITSIDYAPQGLGEYAVALALRVLDGETGLPQNESLPVTFFEGETLADLRV